MVTEIIPEQTLNSVTPEQVLSSSDRVMCKPHNANIPLITCKKRYADSKTNGAFYHCRSCEQGKRIASGSKPDNVVIAKKQESVKQAKNICQICKKEVEKYKNVGNKECAACSSKRYRKEMKEKSSTSLNNQQHEVVMKSQIENKNNGDGYKPNIAETEHVQNMKIVLDFTEYPDLLDKVKSQAKKEFRGVEGQLMCWAWELCGNNLGVKL